LPGCRDPPATPGSLASHGPSKLQSSCCRISLTTRFCAKVAAQSEHYQSRPLISAHPLFARLIPQKLSTLTVNTRQCIHCCPQWSSASLSCFSYCVFIYLCLLSAPAAVTNTDTGECPLATGCRLQIDRATSHECACSSASQLVVDISCRYLRVLAGHATEIGVKQEPRVRIVTATTSFVSAHDHRIPFIAFSAPARISAVPYDIDAQYGTSENRASLGPCTACQNQARPRRRSTA
jgi:hypothetical protein